MKKKYNFIITIESDEEMSDEELTETFYSLHARLGGFYSKAPECLNKVKMNLYFDNKEDVTP